MEISNTSQRYPGYSSWRTVCTWIVLLVGLFHHYFNIVCHSYHFQQQQRKRLRHCCHQRLPLQGNLRKFLVKSTHHVESERIPIVLNFAISNRNEQSCWNDQILRATASTCRCVSSRSIHTESNDWALNSSSRFLDDGTMMSSTQSSALASAVAASTTIRTTFPDKIPTIWSCRHDLFQMIRPNNIPGIILFHMLGVYLVLVHALTTAGTISNIVVPNYWTILLKEPVIWLTLISTNLVSATSMVVNDYYDAKLGRDTLKQHHQQQIKLHHNIGTGGGNDDPSITDSSNNDNIVNDSTDTKWILHPVNGMWNKLVTRRLLMYMYSISLCIATCLPGIPTRLSVNIALMMTYMYTVHFKPITLMKNIVCATLIALAPWTSGSSTLYLLQQQYNINIVATGSSSLSSVLHGGVWAIPSLWRLFGVLFTGVLGREILMDCNDVVADRASGIRTVPVVYGCQIASYVAAFTTGIMTYLSIASPLQQLLSLSSSIASMASPIWTTAPFRRLALAGLGCVIQLNSMRRTLQTKGTNKLVIDQMIEQNLFTVVLLMASFV
jgi:4-hydroxybenzoate polyprenyltransferase